MAEKEGLGKPGAAEGQGEGGVARATGEVEAVRQLPNSIPGFRTEGALNKSLTWLLDISKTEGALKTRAFSSFCGVF